MNRELIKLLRRVEEGARRLAATIVHCYDKPVQDIELARSDLEEITSALNSFKAHVAAGEACWSDAGKIDQGLTRSYAVSRSFLISCRKSIGSQQGRQTPP